jgi:hypothetical protein
MWSGSFSASKLEWQFPRAAVAALVVSSIAIGCSGRSSTVLVPPDQSATGGTGGSGSGGASQAGRGGFGGSGGGRAGSAGAGAGGREDPYVDPGCPDTPAPEGVKECDIFAMPSGCPAGTGCYPDLVHPYGTGCDQQTLNLVCRVAGSGVEGDLCGAGTDGCAPGFTCIVGAESGKRCLRICNPGMGLYCEPGAICGDTDARGIGVCS